jgi:hypothetical protein
MKSFSIAAPIVDLMHTNLLQVLRQRDHPAHRAAGMLWVDNGVTRGREAPHP